MATCERATLVGKPDYALLRLLWSNALRRAFVSTLHIGDFDRTNGTLKILGKGRDTQSQIINLGDATSAAIGDWLAVRPESAIRTDLIFVALDGATLGHRITGGCIYKLVQRKAKKAGIASRYHPTAFGTQLSRWRWMQPTAVRKVQKLSRHKNLTTLMIYDDNWGRDQQDVTEMLDGMF